jgi:outer membrane protein OmpA-like peptidoglycan-associated protein
MRKAQMVSAALAVSLLVSGCAARRWDGCAIAGAVIGAVGGGVGADQGLGSRRGNDNTAIIAGSAVGGMALGAILGHTICDPRLQPPPPSLVPAPSPPQEKVVVTEEQIVTLEPIYFDFDKATIKPVSFAVLDQIVKVMTDRPTVNVRVEGHTDAKGADPYNRRLSQRRAEAVVKYLVAKGIAPERLDAVGLGKSRPIAPNENPDGSDNPQGRAKNRRTEFHIRG